MQRQVNATTAGVKRPDFYHSWSHRNEMLNAFTTFASTHALPRYFYERIPRHVAVLCVFVLYMQSAKKDTVVAAVKTDRYISLTETMWKDLISAEIGIIVVVLS